MKKLNAAVVLVALTFVGTGCGVPQAPTNTVTPLATNTPLSYESSTPSSDREAVWTGTIEGDGEVTVKMNISDNGLHGTYTLAKTKITSEVDGMIDTENNNQIAFSDFNETANVPNIRHFELYEKAPRHYEGIVTKKDDPKTYAVTLDEVSNSLSLQKVFGGHYVRSNTGYIDVLFLDDSHVKIQGLAASPHLAGAAVSSPNIWPLARMGDFSKDDGGGIVRFDDDTCTLVLDFETGAITVAGPTEDESAACGAGGNTTFNGIFKRTAKPIKNWDVFESTR